MKPFVFVVAALALAAGIAAAEPKTFNFDKAHSEVGFDVRHFFNKVHGRFNDYDGSIVFDPQNLPASTVQVTIRDSSIYTGVDRRDNHLRTQDFFWADKYPTISFKSTKVVPGKDANHFQVQGDLTIRDVTKPVTLDTEFLGMGTARMGERVMGTQAGWIATTTINRKDYGITWNRTFDEGGVMLGDDVQITLNVAGVAPAAGGPAAAAKGGK